MTSVKGHLDSLRIQFPVFNPISSGNGVKQEKRPFGSRAKSFVTSCLQCLFFLTQPKQIVFLPRKGHTSENESRKLSYYTRKKRMRFNLSIDCLQACMSNLHWSFLCAKRKECSFFHINALRSNHSKLDFRQHLHIFETKIRAVPR